MLFIARLIRKLVCVSALIFCALQHPAFSYATAQKYNEKDQGSYEVFTNPHDESQNCYKLYKSPSINNDKEEQTEQNVIVLIPDLFSPAHRYDRIMNQTLSKLPDSYMGLTFSPSEGKPSFSKLKTCTDFAVKKLKSDGILNGRVKLHFAGHSFGGLVAQEAGDFYNSGTVILLASYLNRSSAPYNSKRSLRTIHYPLLILGGTADGYTKTPWLLREFLELEQMINDKKYGPEYRHRSPVILLKGVKNSHFSNGVKVKTDLPSELSLEEAHQQISSQIRNFLLANETKHHAYSVNFSKLEAQEELEYAYENTTTILAPFVSATKDYSRICATGQNMLLKEYSLNIAYQQAATLNQLFYAQPKIEPSGRSATLKYSFYSEPNSNWADISVGSYFGDKVICKFLVPKPEVGTNPFGAARNNLISSCTEINHWSKEAGKSMALSQDTWTTDPILDLEINELTELPSFWSHTDESVFSQMDNHVTPHFQIGKTPRKIESVEFYEATCSVLSIASVLEWHTINSHLYSGH